MKSLKNILLILVLGTLFSCEKEESTDNNNNGTPTVTKSSAKDITKFSFAALSPAVDATIDAANKSISATVPATTDLTKLVPTITVSDKATISPATGVAQDFSKAVSYTVTAEDGSTAIWKVNVIKAVENLGTVYFGGYDKKVYALDAATGEKKWEFLAGDNFQSSPAYNDGVLYVTCYDKKLYALDAKTGTKLWDFNTGWYFTNGSPCVANGIVYIPSDYLYAVDAKTGKEIWKYKDSKDGYEFQASPTVVDGVVYCSSRGCAFQAGPSALDAKTGALLWHRGMCVTESSPMVAGNSVYFGNETDGLYSFNKATGEQNWFFDAKDFITTSSPTYSDGLVYIGSWDKNLYAIDANTGVQKWAFNSGNWINSSPIVSDGLLYFGSNNGKVYALDSKTGSKKWEFLTAEYDYVESSPVVANSIVYIGSNDKNLYALDAKTGLKKWVFTTGRGLGTSSAIIVDQNGKVHYNGLSGMAQ